MELSADCGRLDADICWPLSEALKSVPHLKPRAAAEDFRDIRLHLADLLEGIEGFRFVQMSDEIMAKVLPLQLTEEDLEGVTLGASSGGERITPKGARLLARFVRAGACPFPAR